MTLAAYHAEYHTLTQRVEAIQAERAAVEQEARRRLAELERELSEAVTRRVRVEGAIEALSRAAG